MKKKSGSVSFRSSRNVSGKSSSVKKKKQAKARADSGRWGDYSDSRRQSSVRENRYGEDRYGESRYSEDRYGKDSYVRSDAGRDYYDRASYESPEYAARLRASENSGYDWQQGVTSPSGTAGGSSMRPFFRSSAGEYQRTTGRAADDSSYRDSNRFPDLSSERSASRFSGRSSNRGYAGADDEMTRSRSGNAGQAQGGRSARTRRSDRTGSDSMDAAYTQAGSRKSRSSARKKKGKIRGCLLPALLITVILFVLAFILLRSAFSKVEKHKLDMSVISVNQQDKNMRNYQTIALFGVDNQDNVIGDRGSRSDSIIVACINKRTKKVKLMSIYRDTYVSINGEYDKINAAYSYGGPDQAINTINRNLDLNITDFATVNFKALADAVDILGGIPLTINSEKELKNLNDYIGNMNKINGGNSPKFDDVGTYTFDGNQAVAYSRIRYMEGGDHARAGHQRLVVEGILKKAKTRPWKLKSLIDKVLPQCKTSFSTNEFSSMAMGLALYDIVDSQAYPFDSFDEKYNGIYYGFPTTVESNTVAAHKYLYGTKDYQPTEELRRISEKVENITDMIGY